MKATLGGERLGSGNKMTVSMPDYGWSNHDLSFVWRSSMPCGVAIPSMHKVALPGDTLKINLDARVRTRPTVGPLYGAFEIRTSIFTCPIRLYNGVLHNNKVAIGTKMDQVLFPKVEVLNSGNKVKGGSLLDYLCMRGQGTQVGQYEVYNAMTMLAYYDAFKNYLSNKQEPNAKVIVPPDKAVGRIWKVEGITKNTQRGATDTATSESVVVDAEISSPSNRRGGQGGSGSAGSSRPIIVQRSQSDINDNNNNEAVVLGYIAQRQPRNLYQSVYVWLTMPKGFNVKDNIASFVQIEVSPEGGTADERTLFPYVRIVEVVEGSEFIDPETNLEYCKYKVYADAGIPGTAWIGKYANVYVAKAQRDMIPRYTKKIKIADFPLSNIDKAREVILENCTLGESVRLRSDSGAAANVINWLPYTAGISDDGNQGAYEFPLTGLVLTTYKSDINNNWLESELFDGVSGVAQITAVDVTESKFYLDTLNLKQKMYNSLNRIITKGNTYEDWAEAVYDEDMVKRAESPIYEGGASGVIVFDEVVSTSETETSQSGNSPIGTLGGRGTLKNWHDGEITIKVKEPSYIIGITTITPLLDYSQGTDWDLVQLVSMNDLHQPEFDGIGFQNLMAYTLNGRNTLGKNASVGKQPAWIQYMTSVNETHGTFANEEDELFMTLNRRYNEDGSDFTTYIDPVKFNYAFADTELSSQNFWVQIAFNIFARRKMSAKIIPNL